MQEYCEFEGCRRQYLMRYFGEQFPAYCGSCDYCMGNLEERDATIDAQKLLSAIARTGEYFGAGYIIDFLRGSQSEKISQAHRELKTYGIGKNLKREEWQWIIGQLIQHEYLIRTEDQYPILKLTAKSRALLKGEVTLKLITRKPQETPVEEIMQSCDKELLGLLKESRKMIAESANVPPYVILSDYTLEQMATYLPMNNAELSQISGFGDYKIGKYGAVFLEVIREYASKNGKVSKVSTLPAKRIRKPKVEHEITNTQTMSYQMFIDGMSPTEIAEARGLSIGTIEGHLATAIARGKLKIDDCLSEKKILKIRECIDATGETRAAKPIKDLLGDEYSYGEIRMVLSAFYGGQ